MENDHYWITCPRCDGTGVRINPAFSNWSDADIQGDPEGFEKMMQKANNVLCGLCNGLRMVQKGGPEHVRFLQGAPYAETRDYPPSGAGREAGGTR